MILAIIQHHNSETDGETMTVEFEYNELATLILGPHVETVHIIQICAAVTYIHDMFVFSQFVIFYWLDNNFCRY